MAGNNKRGTILVVDDDKMTLTLLAKILDRAFEVVSAHSGAEALDLIEKGLKPGVIISDIYMPEMNGDEFLLKTAKSLPNSTRVLLTADTDPKQVIPCINKAKALMYIKKPWNDLELFQTTVIAYDRYEMTVKVKEYDYFIQEDRIDPDNKFKTQANEIKRIQEILNKEIKNNKSLDEKIKELLENEKLLKAGAVGTETASNSPEYANDPANKTFSDKIPYQSILALSTIIRRIDKFTFLDTTYYVSILVKDLAKELDFSQDKSELLIESALLSFLPISSMPNDLQIAIPFSMDGKERERYFYYFNKLIRTFIKIPGLEEHADLISKIWENKSGFGFPKRLKGDKITLESQILGLSMLYVSIVYRLNDTGMKTLKKTGKVVQTPEDTRKRHKKAIEIIGKNHSWYDDDLYAKFMTISEEESSYTLKPKDVNLEINMLEPKEFGASKKDEQIILDYYDPELILDVKTSFGEDLYVSEKEITASELELGMTVSRNVISSDGKTVIPAKTEITKNFLTNYRQLVGNAMIKSIVWIVTPFDEIVAAEEE